VKGMREKNWKLVHFHRALGKKRRASGTALSTKVCMSLKKRCRRQAKQRKGTCPKKLLGHEVRRKVRREKRRSNRVHHHAGKV